MKQRVALGHLGQLVFGGVLWLCGLRSNTGLSNYPATVSPNGKCENARLTAEPAGVVQRGL